MTKEEEDLIANLESIVRELKNVHGYSTTHVLSCFLRIIDKFIEKRITVNNMDIELKDECYECGASVIYSGSSLLITVKSFGEERSDIITKKYRFCDKKCLVVYFTKEIQR